MELRHLRCFVALAEELHFTRAAARLHIEQSPLSRTIKELEDELGALLFDRDRRGTRLTQIGEVFLLDVRRLFTLLDHARENVRAASAGYRRRLRVAISDGAIDPRLSDFLARCREEEPEVEIRLEEVPLSEQLRGLRSGHFNIGLAHTDDVGEDIVAEPVWQASFVAAIPPRHPLLAHRNVSLQEILRFPLVICAPQVYEGCYRELTRLLRAQGKEPNIVDHVASMDLMLTLVAAGYGVGFMSAARASAYRPQNVIIRTLASDAAVNTIYLLRLRDSSSSIPLDRFTARLLHAQVSDFAASVL